MTTRFHIYRFILAWSAVSSLVALALVKLGMSSPFVYAVKDGVVFLLFIFYFGAWRIGSAFAVLSLWLFAFIVLLFINYLVLNSGYISPLANIRQIISPLVLLLLFISIPLEEAESDRLWRVVVRLVLFVFGFGVFELTASFWERIDLARYFFLKGLAVDSQGLSFMFYEPMVGYARRMVSTFLDPISLGHFFATSISAIYYLPGRIIQHRQKSCIIFVSFVGLILTFSKGAMLQLFISVLVLNPRIPLIIRALSCLLPIALIASLSEVMRSGINIHFSGVINALESLSFFGYGIGSVGNYARMFSKNLNVYYELGISDTYIGSLVGQIGLIGVILWLSFIVAILRLNAFSPASCRYGLKVLVPVLMVSALSENTLNVTSFLFPAALVSLLAKTHYQESSFGS